MAATPLKDAAIREIDAHPNATNRAIARILVHKYPALFASIERARSVVRQARGAQGDAKRHLAARPTPLGIAGEYRREIPRTRAQTRDPVFLPEGNVLVLSDIHAPYHDPDAIRTAVEWRDWDMVLINGDFLDFHRLSRFVPDESAVDTAEELDVARELLEWLVGFGRPVYYKLGNHDERLENYMAMKAPELRMVDFWRIDRLLGLEELGVTMIDQKRIIRCGALNILHGHELSRGAFAPVNPARGALLRTGVPTLIGHHHRSSEHIEGRLDGEVVGAWSTGCLCSLSPGYDPFAKWNHGFAYVERHGDLFEAHNKKIIQGRVV